MKKKKSRQLKYCVFPRRRAVASACARGRRGGRKVKHFLETVAMPWVGKATQEALRMPDTPIYGEKEERKGGRILK